MDSKEKDFFSFTAVSIINVVGSTLLGGVLGFSLTANLELFIVSLLGGFTTLSTFSMEAYELLHAKEWKKAVAYVTVSIVGPLVGFIVGITLVI